MSMTPEQIAFTNSFNKQRSCLALYANCWSLEDLHIVRDGVYLGLAKDLLPDEVYRPVQAVIVTDEKIGVEDTSSGTTLEKLRPMIEVARTSSQWNTLVREVLILSGRVHCDLIKIWGSLERGRMEWLKAVNGAQPLKEILQKALRDDSATDSIGDVSDAKMVWMYALGQNIPSLKEESEQWAKTVHMKDSLQPLQGYKAELWDARHEHWKTLDLGVQAAAERAGTNIELTWKIGI